LRDLVAGDVVRLRRGDMVPADARLLDGDSIEVDESALTGESLPVTAKPGGAVYSGSIIRQGEIDAIVYATGTNTYFGKTAEMVEEAHTVSHFQKAVMKIGDYTPPSFSICAAPAICWVITCGPQMGTLESLKALSWMRLAGTLATSM
jgi:H+-transporting ATPase